MAVVNVMSNAPAGAWMSGRLRCVQASYPQACAYAFTNTDVCARIYRACTVSVDTPNYRTAVSQGLHYEAQLWIFFKYNLCKADSFGIVFHIWLSPINAHLIDTHTVC